MRRPTQLPFEHLNLRYNPFGERPLEERPGSAVLELEPLLAALEAPRAAVLILGHKGRGKTTHLLSLRARLGDVPYIHFPEDGPRPAVPRAPTLVLDELQRMLPWQRARLFAGPARLVIGSHLDHSWGLKLARRPLLRLELRGLSLEKLRRIVELRIARARRSPGAVPWVEDAVLEDLRRRHGDDLRAIEGDLYDAIQTLEAPGPAQLRGAS